MYTQTVKHLGLGVKENVDTVFLIVDQFLAIVFDQKKN